MSQGLFKKTTLKNGIRILTESYSDTKCVELGFWMDRGTRDENAKQQGSAHFVEHMVFKGTKNLNSLEIAKKIEAVGGELNAFTTKEHTCFHTSTLKEDFDTSLNVLSELYFDANFLKEEFDKEKVVVLQEILMAKDDTEDKVFDAYFESCFKGNPLGLPILGTEKSIQDTSRDDLFEFYKDLYTTENLIISAVGAIDHDQVVDKVESLLGSIKKRRHQHTRKKSTWNSLRKMVLDENSEQIHVLLGLPAPSYADKQRFCAFLVNTMMGGGMTSKLYQKIREENGWAYSVFGMLNTFTDCGSQIFYGATDKNLYQKVTETFCDEISKVIKDKVSKEDLEFYRKQTKGQIIIASEDIESRMHSLAVNEMVFGQYKSVDSVVKEIESVSVEEINNYIDNWYQQKDLQIFLFGDLDETQTPWLEAL